MSTLTFDPLIAAAVMGATACTDAVYVMFTNAVVRRKRLLAASWSGVWYLLSSFAVIAIPITGSMWCVRRGWLLHRRLCHHDLAAPWSWLSGAAAGLRIAIICATRASPLVCSRNLSTRIFRRPKFLAGR
jgi:hypothetical protein